MHIYLSAGTVPSNGAMLDFLVQIRCKFNAHFGSEVEMNHKKDKMKFKNCYM